MMRAYVAEIAGKWPIENVSILVQHADELFIYVQVRSSQELEMYTKIVVHLMIV